eukprot:8741_1
MSTPLFSPFTVYDGLCTFSVLVGSMIAAGGGLGGGGVFVPIYILILSFGTKNAAALSQATILGGSIVNLIMNMRARHPLRPHRPLTDFPTLLVFEPMLLVGTVLGVLLNVIFPSMLILILLILTLAYATFRTANKGRIMWHKESAALQPPSIAGYITDSSGPGGPSINDGYDTTESEDRNSLIYLTDTALTAYDDKEQLIRKIHDSSYGSFGKNNDQSLWLEMAQMCGVDVRQLTHKKIALLQPLMNKEKEVWKPLGIIALIWIISSSTSIGKNANISGVASCSALYWVVSFISFPVLLLLSLYITKQQFNVFDRKDQSDGWVKAEGDIQWNQSMMNMIKYPLIAMFAGLLGGLLGIGGGMIVSPLLMELGVLPSVAAATSAMAVLITSSSATLQFVLLGYLRLDYTFYFMAIGIIGTFIGQTVVMYCIKQYGRKSLIVFSVAIIMGSAIILMGIDGVMQAMDGISWTFATPC